MKGNAFVSRQIETGRNQQPNVASMQEIEGGSRNAASDGSQRLAFAGTPLRKEPPEGMKFIANQSSPIGLGGKPAGYTAIKSAAAFAMPSFTTRSVVEKDGYKRHYFVEIEPTTATDVTHSSYYPAPGTHDNAISEQKDGIYSYFWTISPKISEMIRIGEQEHLDDAKHAYDLTYALIAKEINAMVGTRLGPAESPGAAEALAEKELARRLPAALGTNPSTWFNVLEEMLTMSLKRDRQHLHDLVPGKAVVKGKNYYIPLEATPQTKIDEVHSDQIVTYPVGHAAPGPAPTTQPTAHETPPPEKRGE